MTTLGARQSCASPVEYSKSARGVRILHGNRLSFQLLRLVFEPPLAAKPGQKPIMQELAAAVMVEMHNFDAHPVLPGV